MRQNTQTLIGNYNTNTSGVTTLTAEFDTRGFSFAKLIVLANTTATAVTGTNNKVEDGDTTSTYATFAGFISGTDWTVATSTNSTALAKMIYNVDLRGRKRYLKVTTGLAATAVGYSILAELSNPADGVSDAASAGAANISPL